MVVGRNQPAKRFPLVQPLFHETYLQAMYRQKYTSDHWRRIDYAKPMIDDGPPLQIINTRMKLKKILTRGEELARIEKYNKFLLRNIIGVMKGPAIVDHYFKVPANARPHSMNYDVKKNWVKKVNIENRAMLRRIINTRTMYDRLEMERNYQHMIRSIRGRRYVFDLWKAQHRHRRYCIMSGKCDHPNSGVATDMEALRTRTLKTHSRCFPPDHLEPFHSMEVPRTSRSTSGTPRVDHHRCFSPLPCKPSVRCAPQCPAIFKKKARYPVALTRAHRLRLEAIRAWIKTVVQDSPLSGDKRKTKRSRITSQPEKGKNINQSASTSYSRNSREACTKDIGKNSKPNQPREEKVLKSGKECNKLPKLPSSKLSKEVSSFRPCALRVGDTSLSAPCWKPVIPSCSERMTRQNDSQIEKNVRDIYGQTIKRSTVTSLPHIIPNRGTDGLAASKHSSKTSTNSASSSKSVKVCPKEQRIQKLHTDVGNSHHGNTETVSGQKAHSSETFSSIVASQKNRITLPTQETKRRAEQQEGVALPGRTHPMASRQNRSEPGTNQKSSADKNKPQPEKNQIKNNPELLRVKRSSRKNSPVNFERDVQSTLYPPVTRRFLMPISEVSNKDFTGMLPCSDAFPSFKLLKKTETLANRTQEKELSLPKPDSPHPKTSTKNDDREIPEEISLPVIPPLNWLKESPTSGPSTEAESKDHPGLSSEKLELCIKHSPSPDSVSEDSEDDTAHKDVEEPLQNTSARDGSSAKASQGSSCPSPLKSDMIEMVATENHCGLPDLGVLHSLGLATLTFSTEQGIALDRLIFSDDSDEEECADDASVYSEED